jgi:benzoyl-CoA reductase/2-hydroxyglutaryl-CoA dehydratase subunit BcrC/BadD/HgdB
MNPDFKRKNIESLAISNKYMAAYYQELKQADETKSKKVAWSTSLGPAELLRSMGFLVYFPENHGATLAAMRLGPDLIDATTAETQWTPNVCSYATADIGAYLKKTTPLTKFGLTKVPDPAVLVYNLAQCRDVQDWYEWYNVQTGAPALGLRMPRGVNSSQKDLLLDLGNKEVKELITQLEKIGGTKFDIDRYREVVKLSRQCSDAWNHCLDLNAASPAPWTFFDQCIHMAPAVVLRGLPEAVEYYQVLGKELQGFVDRKEAAVPGEKVRLLWAGIPVWGAIGSLSKKLGILQAPIVASTYCSSWVFKWDTQNPLESLSDVYCASQFITQDDKTRQARIEHLCDTFKVDGIIYHDCWTCGFTSENRYGQANRVQRTKGIKSIVINGDVADTRLFSVEQTMTQLEAFVEELEENK